MWKGGRNTAKFSVLTYQASLARGRSRFCASLNCLNSQILQLIALLDETYCCWRPRCIPLTHGLYYKRFMTFYQLKHYPVGHWCCIKGSQERSWSRDSSTLLKSFLLRLSIGIGTRKSLGRVTESASTVIFGFTHQTKLPPLTVKPPSLLGSRTTSAWFSCLAFSTSPSTIQNPGI
ncbi:hypothetical protein B9Z19DRAFT_785304 [Tuber borchii]|uniref:Uncharacterized protein n=1 Tax=Tuber borchii TaxID=42251 RepID=A0A2T7A7H6_TUBBO|nr:hypothetical protein B9Z19DRAFT_785304 [Tuber borchii]